ncbi:alanine racemase [Methylocapsa acidiphila]|uniref:alanine racemase n=1 Tax=Methylocapsa acidiphila TaxID=133552 RepID=UPI000427B5B6|nr:alanine racemase [Methylocapsa acidiphila]
MKTAGRAEVPQLEAGAVLSIDLKALVDNWRALQAVCGEAECGAVVKADAYGLGMEPIVRALVGAGCKTYFVAHIFEGRHLRALSRDAVIYVLNGLLPGTAPAYAAYDLRPVLASIPEIEEWLQFIAFSGALARTGDGPPPAALQIDTGMNRLGLKGDDLDAAEQIIGQMNISLVLSHLVWTGHGDAGGAVVQIDAFERMRARWFDLPASMANSAGVFLDRHPLYNMVRPGYALYGGNPTPGRPNPMRSVVRLEAKILQIHQAAPGESVGYDAGSTVKGARRLATISAGYADGIPHSTTACDARPGGQAIVRGRRCPFVGSVSMDLIVIDVSEVGDAQRGDMVELIGPTITIDEVAARSGTIGYEILTKLGRRFYRRYTRL